jgi:hypothetical protein
MSVVGPQNDSVDEPRAARPTLSIAEAFFDALFRMSAIAVIASACAFLVFDIEMVEPQVMFMGIGTIIAVTMAYVPFETIRARRLEYPICNLGDLQRVRLNLLFAASVMVGGITICRYVIGSRYVGKETVGLIAVLAALSAYSFLQSRRLPARHVAIELPKTVKLIFLVQFCLLCGWACAILAIFWYAENQWQFTLFVSVTVVYYLAKRQTWRLFPQPEPSRVAAQTKADDRVAEQPASPIR